MDSTEKFRQDVQRHIDTHAGCLDLPDSTVAIAKNAYDSYITPKNAYSRPGQMFALASLFVGIRIKGHPMSMRDLTDGVDQEHADVMRVFMRMVKELGLTIGIHDPEVFVDRINEGIQRAPAEIGILSKRIIGETRHVTQGNRPSAVAAGAYYLASKMLDNLVMQSLISDVANVSALTIRNRYQEMEDALPDDFEVGVSA